MWTSSIDIRRTDLQANPRKVRSALRGTPVARRRSGATFASIKIKVALTALALSLAAVLAGALLLAGGGGEQRKPQRPAASGHEQPASMRTLVVYDTASEPAPSSPGALMRARRVAGPLPGGAAVATVLSDEQCQADEAGISHCLNKLRLPSGQTLSVRHPHDMMRVACMTPGERVRVVKA